MAVEFISVNRNTPHLFPPCVEDYLPEDHLARFVVDMVERLDVSPLVAVYEGRGSKPYHPRMMPALLFYGYATGTFSNRKLEKATYDSMAYMYICANTHPDHDSINTFRQRFLKELKGLFLAILVIAKEMGTLKLGTVSLDGTKIKANASRHKALSWKYAQALERQLQGEVDELMRMAEQADHRARPEQLDIPEELAHRQHRLAAIRRARHEIEARARHRHEHEQAAYEAKLADRQARERKPGKKSGGRPPEPPVSEPRDRDQVNLTDDESRIMPTAGGGFEQSHHAQASVDIESGLIVSNHLSQQPNDRRELEPTLAQLVAQEGALGKAENLLADVGYCNANNVRASLKARITPYPSTHREPHHVSLAARLTPAAADPPATDDPVAQMRYRLGTEAGRALYAKRKSTTEPTFGIIKHVLGFRQFLLRGLDKVEGEWDLVCIGFNLKRMFELTA